MPKTSIASPGTAGTVDRLALVAADARDEFSKQSIFHCGGPACSCMAEE